MAKGREGEQLMWCDYIKWTQGRRSIQGLSFLQEEKGAGWWGYRGLSQGENLTSWVLPSYPSCCPSRPWQTFHLNRGKEGLFSVLPNIIISFNMNDFQLLRASWTSREGWDALSPFPYIKQPHKKQRPTGGTDLWHEIDRKLGHLCSIAMLFNKCLSKNKNTH